MHKASITTLVEEGELHRLALITSQEQTTQSGRGSGLTEIVMFYGQAFEKVRQATIEHIARRLDAGLARGDAYALDSASVVLSRSILHECVLGLAIYRVWLTHETSLAAHVECQRMREYWLRIVQIATGTRET